MDDLVQQSQLMSMREVDEDGNEHNEYLRNSTANMSFTSKMPSIMHAQSFSLRAESVQRATTMPPKPTQTPKTSSNPAGPWTVTTPKLEKRKNTEEEDTDSLKRVKLAQSVSDREWQRCADHLYDQYVVRGGYGHGMLEKTDFLSALPGNMNDESPQRTIDLQNARLRVSAREKEKEQEQARLPVDDAQFLRLASKQILGYAVTPSKRLTALAAVLSDPQKKNATLGTAREILLRHQNRLQEQLTRAKTLCEDLRKGGDAVAKPAEQLTAVVRQLQNHHDSFAARVAVL
jgi:hypothetical protein